MSLDLGDTNYPPDDARARRKHLPADIDILAKLPDARAGRAHSEFVATLVRDGFRIACFDLDMSLVNSAPVYISLEIATCAHFGFTDAAAVTRRHRELQARSGDEIMQGLYDLGGGKDALRCELNEFNAHFMALVQRWSAGETSLELPPHPMPSARELVEVVRPAMQRALIATGSKTPVAELLLRDSGMMDLFERGDIVCSDVTPYKKNEPAYWPHVLRGEDPSRAVGFEDNPEAAAWLLAAGFGRVVLRPWRHFDETADLIRRFPDRLRLVNEWGELL